MASGGRAWLAAVLVITGAAGARAQSFGPDDTVRLPPPAAGAFRFRYELTLWAPPPIGVAAADTAAPLARTVVVVDEVLATDRTLTRAVRGADVDMPLLASFGAEGRAYARRLAAALAAGRAADTLDARNRAPGRRSAPAAATASTVTAAGDLLLAAVGPLGILPPLPANAVRPGEAWTDTVVVRVPGSVLEEPLAVPATLRLGAIRADAAGASADITVAARIRHAVLSDGSTVDLTLSGGTVLDLAAGVPVRATAQLRASVRDPRGAVTPLRARLSAVRLALPGQGDVAAGR